MNSPVTWTGHKIVPAAGGYSSFDLIRDLFVQLMHIVVVGPCLTVAGVDISSLTSHRTMPHIFTIHKELVQVILR